MNSRYIMTIKWITGADKGKTTTRYPNVKFKIGKIYAGIDGGLYIPTEIKDNPDWKRPTGEDVVSVML